LSQSQSVKLVDGQAVSDALTRMQKSPSLALTPALAREVAVREGVPAIVTGEVDAVGKGYVVPARVVSASNDAVLTAVRETAASDVELIPALDRLSRALRERIGESLVSIRADPPLEHVTTSSLDALRKYSQAIQLADGGQVSASIPLLQQATAIDTGFAMAWRKLASELLNSGAPLSKISDAAVRAYRNRDRLPELEKQASAASYFDNVEHDYPRAIDAYRAMLAIDSDNVIALNNVSMALFATRQFPEAESDALRCMAHGNYATCPFNALNAQLEQDKGAAAESTLARWQQHSPHEPLVTNSRFALAAWKHDYAGAEQSAREIEQYAREAGGSDPGSQLWQESDTEDMAALDGVQGRLARGEVLLNAAAAIDEARGLPAAYVNRAAQVAQIRFTHQAGTSEALATLA